MTSNRSSGWRKSRRSNSEGACVEVAARPAATVAVRDSKDPDGPELKFDADAWRRFLARTRQR